MKKILQLCMAGLLLVFAASCSQGAAAIEKAFEQACKAASPEEVATTLCNGHIKCESLTTDEFAKLGACLGYITYTGMYSSNFEAQVDMHQFGDLLNQYRDHQNRQSSDERQLVEKYTRQILTTEPVDVPTE